MEYRNIGSTSLIVSRVGFGCWAIGGHGYGPVSDDDSIRAVQEAYSLGINFFDTADVYGFGHSESVLSKALGSHRHDAVIATKFGVCWDEDGRTFRNTSRRRVVEALEGSLRRLRIDCIPLYQIHWHDGKTPITETLEALLRCRDEGKIRHIGCSNISEELVEEANAISTFSSIQMLFNAAQRENEPLLRKCAHLHKMGVITYGVLARGLFSGKYSSSVLFGESDTRATDASFRGEKLEWLLGFASEFKRLGRDYGRSPSQVAIRWVLDAGFVTSAIVGIKRADQVVENVRSLGWTLAERDWEYLSKLTSVRPI